jgi:hypothetical protein
MVTQRENSAGSHVDGRMQRLAGVAAAWLLFYALAALAGIVAIYSEEAVHQVAIAIGVWP